MFDWLAIGLIAVGLGLIVSGIIKRQSRIRNPVPAGAIRPEFAAMGEMIRPIILFCVAVFAGKMTLFYFVLGGQRYLTPLDFAGILFVLAAYSGYLIAATSRRAVAPVSDEIPSGERSPA
ncbi:MAG: hypothetical protein ABSC06_07990 [Rhodopila sp.]|jgi:hypothetical protein